MNKSKKLLSLFLALCMALTLSPATALAAEDSPVDGATTQQEVENDTYEEILPDETATPDVDGEEESADTAEDGITPQAEGDESEAPTSGTCGANLTWNIIGDVLMISGSGAMSDYDDDNPAPWRKSAFTSVSIENSVTSIGNRAFVSYDALTSVTIPDSVISIGEDAFCNCGNLTSVTIPDSVTSIGGKTFGASFRLCDKLTEIQVNENNPSYMSENGILFTKSKTTLVQYPVGKTDSSYTIPNCVTTIGNNAFEGCDSLTSVTIPERVTSIDDCAFRFCNGLISVTIPESVTSIGSGAFYACSKLTSVTILGNVTYIQAQTFAYDTNLTVTIPASVTYIGYRAFYPTTINAIYYGGSQEEWAAIAGQGKPDALATTIYYNGVLPDAPSGDNLTWSITDEVLTISGTGSMSNYDFHGHPAPWDDNKFTSVIIEYGVTSIGNAAFAGCNELTSVTIPDSVTSIGEYAFGNCRELTSINIPSSVTSIGKEAFDYCNKLTEIQVDADNPSYMSENGVLFTKSGTALVRYPEGKSDSSYTIPNHVTSIGDNAFYQCQNLISMTIPGNVTFIGNSAFYTCRGLTRITLLDGVTSIGLEAFGICDKLTTVALPASVASIEYDAFFSDYDLKDVYYGGGETDWAAIQINDGNEYLTDAEIHYNSAAPDEPDEPSATQYTITFDPNGGTLSGSSTMTTDENGKLASLPTPTHEGYTFDGWYTAQDDSGEKITADYAFKSSTTIYAHWMKNGDDTPDNPGDNTPENPTSTYTISFDTNGGVLSGAATMTTDENGKLTSLPSATRSNCIFNGWYTTKTGGEQITIDTVFTADTTVYAQWSYSGGGGSSSGGGSSGGGGGSSSSSNTTTTTNNPDGSTTTTATNNSTGAVTTTTIDAAGNKTETVTQKDGSSVVTVTRTDGTTATITTSANGQVTAEVKLSAETVNAAQQNNQTAALPIQPVQAVRDTAAAPSVMVNTGSAESIKVEIPVANLTPGTVAVLVRADGTEEIIKRSVLTANGISVTLPDGATVKIKDNTPAFTDITSQHWAMDAVTFSAARELFNGTTATTFSPEAPVTRAMLVTVLARFDGVDTSGGEAWYDKGREWAVSNNVSDGTNLDVSVTREQMVTMFWRYMGSPASSGDLSSFTDADQISDYAKEAMRWAVENGIMHGRDNGVLDCAGQTTRAELATIFMNFIQE